MDYDFNDPDDRAILLALQQKNRKMLMALPKWTPKNIGDLLMANLIWLPELGEFATPVAFLKELSQDSRLPIVGASFLKEKVRAAEVANELYIHSFSTSWNHGNSN